MNRRPCIGIWKPTNRIEEPSRSSEEGPGARQDQTAAPDGLPQAIGDLVDWVPFTPTGHGIGVTSAEDSGGPALPLHGLVMDEGTSLDQVPQAENGDPDPGAEAGTNPPSLASVLLAYLPVIGATQLTEPDERESFFERAVAIGQLQQLFEPGWRVTDVVAFNAKERFRAIVHDPKKHKLMGRIVAKGKDHPRETLMGEFSELYLSALAKPVTRRKHQSLFKHVDELLGDRLAESEHLALQAVIEAYRQGSLERAVPLRHLQKHILALRVRGLETQSYLFPSALEAACLELERHQDIDEG